MSNDLNELRVVPHSEEAERGVLGSVLLAPMESIGKAVLNDFRINCCSMTTFRPQGAVQKFKNYLVQATDKRRQALEKQQKNKPIRRNSIATAGK